MKYSTFEKLLLAVGIGSVVVIVALALSEAQPNIKEVVGHILIIPILFGALHYGRWGGIISSLAALLTYTLIYLPTTLVLGYSSTAPLLAIRGLTYGLIGIGGGELAHRIKYIFAQLEHLGSVDPLTGLYARDYFAEIISSNTDLFNRYQVVFSIITIKINSKALSTLKSQNLQIKKVGGAIKTNVRAIDEVARTNTLAFGLLLPHTPPSKASHVTQRLKKMIPSLLPKSTKSQNLSTLIHVETMGYPGDKQKIEELVEDLKKH